MTDADRRDAGEAPRSERRVHHRVRVVFSEACALLAPLLLEADPSAQASGFAMAHMVRNRFPELSDGEVHVLITAAARLKREQRLHAIIGA
ncbi:MAG: hypothetical protein MUC79_05085 [Thiobacillaceae bacterium]|nr:hypothetical protein [Thiobacillaceae bacterium]